MHGCLNKNPKARPAYDVLLKHAWMKPLAKEYDAIKEEPEEEDGAAPEADGVEGAVEGMCALEIEEGVVDGVVAGWVRGALERKAREEKERREGGKEGGSAESGARPALHAAPLDSVSPGMGPMGGPMAGS